MLIQFPCYPGSNVCETQHQDMISESEWKKDCNQPTLNSRIMDLIDLWFRLTMTTRVHKCVWMGEFRKWHTVCVMAGSWLSRTSWHWILHSVYPYPGVVVLFSRARLIQMLTHAHTRMNACTHFIISAFVDWLDHITIHFIPFYLW